MHAVRILFAYVSGGRDMHRVPDHRSHHYSMRVPFADIDLGGVVYHAHYLRYFDQARMEWYRANGVDLAEMMSGQRRGLIVCGIETEFMSPACHDELLTIQTTLDEFTGVRLAFRQDVYREDRLIARGRTKLAGISMDTLRPARIPFSFALE
ncbi:4-hydroxybenzoyl-CoA thioesterase [Burkholderia sp. AU31652]|nr:4-hydroxybenzoyl-CoA thioesterase [Burkholderia sp. AU31652]